MIKILWFVSLLLMCLLTFLQASIIINTSVKQNWDLSTHIVRYQSDIDIHAMNDDVNDYIIAFPKEINSHLAYISAKCGKLTCEVTPFVYDLNAYAHYRITLKKALPKGENLKIRVKAHFTHVLHPYPTEILQNEDQFVVFEIPHLFISPYVTSTQTIKFKLPFPVEIEDYTESLEPIEKKGSTITYGPFTEIPIYAPEAETIRLHFKNNSPFITLTSFTKEVEISMWGRVSIEEVYDLAHTGAKLKGGFSRFDYMHGDKGASFYNLMMILPKDAMNVYYRDQIGNVSTSRLRPATSQKELQEFHFTPRFPLFGGWKTQWYLGYGVPTHSVLTKKDGQFKLSVDFSTSLDHIAINDMTFKIILPEGATNVQVNVPFNLDAEESRTRQTYLDTPLVRRQVVILHKKNVIDLHNVPVVVVFDFPMMFMLHEPFLLVSGFFLLFVICMIAFRIDISLGYKKVLDKKKDE